MTIQFCKSCQENNINTRVEWRPNPDKPGKNKPFDVDKQEWHSPCPYWKKDKPKYEPNAKYMAVGNDFEKVPDLGFMKTHIEGIEMGILQLVSMVKTGLVTAYGEDAADRIEKQAEENAELKTALKFETKKNLELQVNKK